ncbi:MAG: 3-hydroxyacyl-CoA dehydrogenase [bacterium]
MKVDKIAVIGAGIMGSGIAQVACLGGFQTVLQDLSENVLKEAVASIQNNFDKAVQKKLITRIQEQSANNRLCIETKLDNAVKDADLIIEAIPENIELKIDLFSKIDKLCKTTTVFASNTSSLSITEMAADTERPAQIIGMHFFNPVHKMKLVEIVKGLETSEETIQCVIEVATTMGKETVTIKESPGFITSRINALIGNEAFYMLQEGIASAEDIDKALKLGLNHPMGPFEMVDLVGLDTRLSILKFLHQTLGEKYRPCPLLVQYVKAGRLGRKTGKGIYNYAEKK